ncbi:hypothetical protein QJQ45_000552 [Haematococcus lacustris]|nr:hypothetical protein QJQ45_000552 [Haematococcus lacustris]
MAGVTMFILRHLVHAQKASADAKHRKLFTAFIEQAYDHIPRQQLWEHLRVGVKLPQPLLACLEGLYRDDSYVLIDGPHRTPPVTPDQGVKQDCPISPLLFALYVHDISKEFLGPVDAVRVQGTPVTYFMYADDLTLVVNGMKWVSRQHYHQERGVAVYLGAGRFSQGGWKANAVREGFRKVVEQPSRPGLARPDRLVIVDEFRTTHVSSSVHARQPCELHLPNDRPRPADWVPPAGQVNQRLLRPAWSLRHSKDVRGLKWCHEVPPNPPPPPLAQHPPAQDPPAPAQDPPAPAQDPPPPPPAQEPPPPAQDQPPAQAPPGPAPRPQAPPWGRWLDRDTNSCLNFQRIGESKQHPLELCSYEGLKALPPIGKEYQQGYKRVHDRLPKVKQRLHRAAEYRRGTDGRARNNA